MNCKVMIHKGYAEWELAKEDGHDVRQLFGKYHFIFESKIGKISLIQMKPFLTDMGYWEIFCLEGNLFEDTERFDTRQEAEKKIGKILEV